MEKNHQDGALGAEHVRQIGTHGVQRTEEEIFFRNITTSNAPRRRTFFY